MGGIIQIRHQKDGLNVEEGVFSQVTSSKTRMKIVELLSQRPRSLRELSESTGISMPGVLRQLKSLRKLGLVSEKGFKSKSFRIRKLYELDGASLHDFSVGGLIIFKAGNRKAAAGSISSSEDLEELAQGLFVQRRQIKDRARRLARIIDLMVEDEVELMSLIERMSLGQEERLVLQTALTEETLEDAERVLTRIQGMKDARRSIDDALAKARRSAKK